MGKTGRGVIWVEKRWYKQLFRFYLNNHTMRAVGKKFDKKKFGNVK
jgi:hypothetical protein